MSQNMRNQSSDSYGNSGRGLNENQDRTTYEGFDGMNYEQVRQPYNPQHTNTNRGNDKSSDSERHDEL